VLGHRVNKFN